MQRVRDLIKPANIDANGTFKYIQILLDPYQDP
jgi:hypothetical protein